MNLKDILFTAGIGIGIAGLSMQANGCAPAREASSATRLEQKEDSGIPYANPPPKKEEWFMQNTPGAMLREAVAHIYSLRRQYLEEADSLGFTGSVVFPNSGIYIDNDITHCAQYIPEDTISYVLQIHHGPNPRIVSIVYRGDISLPITLQYPLAVEQVRISDGGRVGLYWDAESPDYAIHNMDAMHSAASVPPTSMTARLQEIELDIANKTVDLLRVGVSELKIQKMRREIERRIEKRKRQQESTDEHQIRKT